MELCLQKRGSVELYPKHRYQVFKLLDYDSMLYHCSKDYCLSLEMKWSFLFQGMPVSEVATVTISK